VGLENSVKASEKYSASFATSNARLYGKAKSDAVPYPSRAYGVVALSPIPW